MPKKKLQKKETPPYSIRTLKESDRKRVARGEDLYGYGEQKKRFNLSLTPTAIANITALAEEVNLSRSETIERLFRIKKHHQTLVSMIKKK